MNEASHQHWMSELHKLELISFKSTRGLSPVSDGTCTHPLTRGTDNFLIDKFCF